MITGFETSEMEKLVNALRGKAMYTVSLGKDNKPKSVAVALKRGQMNVYEDGLDGMLSVTIDHMNAVPAEYVLELLGIEDDQDARDLRDAIAADDGKRYSMQEVMDLMESK